MANNGWTSTTLGSLADAGEALIQTGPFGSQLHSHDYRTTGIPVVPTEAIGRRRLKSDVIPLIDLEKANELARHRLQAGDILFARRGVQATGLSAIVDPCHDGWLCGTGAILLRVRGKTLDPTFLSFFLSDANTIAWLKAHAVGAVMPNLNETVLRLLPISFPSLQKQHRIAEILGALDDKIELNRQMNQTLEAMTRAHFKSWFVDFDPVRVKAAGRKPNGLAPEVAKLFFDDFAMSRAGRIPKGWAAASLGDHVEAMKGLSYKGEGLSEKGVPLHNLNSIYEGGGYKFEGIKWYTGEYRERHLIRPGDVIVANTEQGHDCLLLGYAAIVPENYGQPALFSHHLYRLRNKPDSPFTADYLCHLLNSPTMHDLVSGFGNGTTVNMLPVDGVQQPECAVPPKGLVDRFSEVAASVRSRCERFVTENCDLARARDALLPKLLSGAIEV